MLNVEEIDIKMECIEFFNVFSVLKFLILVPYILA